MRYHQSESLPLKLPKAEGGKEISSCEKREGGNRNEELKNKMCLGYLHDGSHSNWFKMKIDLK